MRKWAIWALACEAYARKVCSKFMKSQKCLLCVVAKPGDSKEVVIINKSSSLKGLNSHWEKSISSTHRFKHLKIAASGSDLVMPTKLWMML